MTKDITWALCCVSGQEACSNGRTSPVYMMPVVPPQQVTSFPELLDLSTTQLQQLLQSKDRLDEFVDRLPPMQRQNNAVEYMITKNEELASEQWELVLKMIKVCHWCPFAQCTVSHYSVNICIMYSVIKNFPFKFFFTRIGVRQEVEISHKYFIINFLLRGCWIQVVTLLHCYSVSQIQSFLV